MAYDPTSPEQTIFTFRPRQWWALRDLLFLAVIEVGLVLLIGPNEAWESLTLVTWSPATIVLLLPLLPALGALIVLAKGQRHPQSALVFHPRDGSLEGIVRAEPEVHLAELLLDDIAFAAVAARPVARRPAHWFFLVPRRAYGFFPVFFRRAGGCYFLHQTPGSSRAAAAHFARRLNNWLTGHRQENASLEKKPSDAPREFIVPVHPVDFARRASPFGVAAAFLAAGVAFSGAAQPLAEPWKTNELAINARGAILLVFGSQSALDDVALLAARAGVETGSTEKKPKEDAEKPEDAAPGEAPAAEIASGIQYFSNPQGAELTFLDTVAYNRYEAMEDELRILLNYYQEQKRASYTTLQVLKNLIAQPVRNLGAIHLVLMIRCMGEVGRPEDADDLAVLLEDAKQFRMGRLTQFEQNSVVDALEKAVKKIRDRNAPGAS